MEEEPLSLLRNQVEEGTGGARLEATPEQAHPGAAIRV
jgi:hypothetical protein